MKLEDDFKLRGELLIRLFGPDGALKREVRVPNLVVTTGKNFCASRLKDASVAAMSHMAVGTGVVAAAAGDTGLGTESARVALDSTIASNNVVTYVATFPAGTGTASLTEAGIFNANSVGVMLARSVFGVITKGTADVLIITWTVTLG